MMQGLKFALILHQFQISCIYMLLIDLGLGDWVKTTFTTWYLQFVMT